MTLEQSAKLVARQIILHQWNEKQIATFKAGGMAMPTCKTWEDFEKLQEVLKKFFKSSTVKLFKDVEPSGVIFDLPMEYAQ